MPNDYPTLAGTLDRRITVERFSTNTSQMNNPIKVWGTLADLWASKADVSDAERLQSQEVGAEITTRFRVRYSEVTSTITPKDRVRFNGMIYDIISLKELGRKIGFEISAVARADTAQAG